MGIMSRLAKACLRLSRIPKDFEWNEARYLLSQFGYEEHQASGSRVRFRHPGTKRKIILHKPHPGSIMDPNAVEDLYERLLEEGHIDAEGSPQIR